MMFDLYLKKGIVKSRIQNWLQQFATGLLVFRVGGWVDTEENKINPNSA